MVINVTQDHIDKGIPGSAYGCMLYRAISDVLKPLMGTNIIAGWGVSVNHVWIDTLAGTEHITLSKRAYYAAYKFDNGKRAQVKPFRFKLDIDHLLVINHD